MHIILESKINLLSLVVFPVQYVLSSFWFALLFKMEEEMN